MIETAPVKPMQHILRFRRLSSIRSLCEPVIAAAACPRRSSLLTKNETGQEQIKHGIWLITT